MISTNKEKIMIAGASGMVGSAIFRCYIKSKKNPENILIPNRSELDLSNYGEVEKWFSIKKPEIVIIAAAKVGGIYANQNYPGEFLIENLKIQTNLIDVSMRFKTKKLLFLSSSCIYPKFAQQPIVEEDLLNGPLEPTSSYYAIAKVAGVKLCEAMRIQYGLNAICLVPPNLFGPKDNYHPENSHVLPSLIKKFIEAKEKNLNSVTCWGSGSPLREFLFVDDLAEACLFALDKWDATNDNAPKDDSGRNLGWLNVGSNIEISIKNLALKISKILGYEGKIIWDEKKPNGTSRKKLNWERFQKLGWEPKTSLDKGLKLAINDYKMRYLKDS